MDTTNMAVADGTALFNAALGVAGANQSGAGMALFPILGKQLSRVLLLPTGTTTLTLAMLAAYDLFVAASNGNTEILIPTFATLGWNRIPSTPLLPAGTPLELTFRMACYQGGGPAFINAASGVTLVTNGLDTNTMTQNGPIITTTTAGNDIWVSR